jgi:hypothetical protein
MSTPATGQWREHLWHGDYTFALAGERGDLVAFLLARWEEDEAEARASADADAEFWDGISGDDTYFARHAPARVLREVIGGLGILARYEDALRRREDDEYPAGPADEQAREYEDFVLPGLALAYNDHLDYDADFAP